MKKSSNIIVRSKSRVLLLVSTVFCLVSILVLALFPATRRGPLGFGISNTMATFQVKNGNLTMSYPQNWVALDTPQGSHGDNETIAVILVAGKQLANITIAQSSFLTGNLDDVLNWGQERSKQHARFELLSLGRWKKTNLQGYISEYLWVNSGVFATTCRCQDLYILSGNDGYDLSFCASEKDWSSLQSTYEQMQLSVSTSGE